jgi:hypothetical protein
MAGPALAQRVDMLFWKTRVGMMAKFVVLVVCDRYDD